MRVVRWPPGRRASTACLLFLFSVALYLETVAGSDFTFLRLDRLTGESLEDLVDHAGTQDEKHALVQAGSQKPSVRPC